MNVRVSNRWMDLTKDDINQLAQTYNDLATEGNRGGPFSAMSHQELRNSNWRDGGLQE